ncbi:cupin domain-containing protein [Amaricoccus solimangrovi]|uniref:Cupin domain-containing protein n=1 Tax=Amaricoccus solimangrovi TaxID=2589815 RepID=A0A501X0W7_9RHOB|nr:cupin domain-containing protein [Amaricoccus solimangrovi]TPE52756.1 cupin domain-containing protein [Amaricoccus solimangrovi]
MHDDPAWLLPGPFPPEFATEERCFIVEELNDPACPGTSLARARVAPGVTTRLHLLRGTIECYVIREGRGRVEVGGAARDVGPGDRVVIPADTPQRITNIGAGDLVFHCLCAPRFLPENYVDVE